MGGIKDMKILIGGQSDFSTEGKFWGKIRILGFDKTISYGGLRAERAASARRRRNLFFEKSLCLSSVSPSDEDISTIRYETMKH